MCDEQNLFSSFIDNMSQWPPAGNAGADIPWRVAGRANGQ